MKNQCVDKWIITALRLDKTPSTEHATPGTFSGHPGHLRLCFVTSSKMRRKDDLGWESVVLYYFIQATQELILLANMCMHNFRIISFLPLMMCNRKIVVTNLLVALGI